MLQLDQKNSLDHSSSNSSFPANISSPSIITTVLARRASIIRRAALAIIPFHLFVRLGDHNWAIQRTLQLLLRRLNLLLPLSLSSLSFPSLPTLSTQIIDLLVCEAWSGSNDQETFFSLKTVGADVGIGTEIALYFFGDGSFIDFVVRDPVLIHPL